MLFFTSKENQCIFRILTILHNKKSTYTKMFRDTKVSHTTLQRVLMKLQEQNLISKYDIGHKKVDYEISDRGVKILLLLRELKKYLKNSL